MACVEQRPGHCQTINRCCLASSRLSHVLPSLIATKETYQANDQCRDSSSHPADGQRESDNEVHLRRLMRDYISYNHADRIHNSLGKDTQVMRSVSTKPHPSAIVVSFRRVGGLHHRYDWQQAA